MTMHHRTVLFKLATDPMDSYYEPYFRGKKRTFEIMVQVE